MPVCRDVIGSMRRLVEVDPALGEHELDHAVDRVEADPAEERGQRVPVEAQIPPGEQRDAGDEESEVEDELDHPLRPLRERLTGVEAVEARQVDEREHDEERERDHRRAGEAAVVSLEAVPREQREEDGREDVRESQRARELPLQLVEGDREDRQEEEPVEHRLDEHALARCGAWCGERVARHAISSTSAASSSTRARRESLSSSRFASSTESSPPSRTAPAGRRAPRESPRRRRVPPLRPRRSRARAPRPRRPAARPPGWDGGCDVLVDLPGEDALPTAAGVGNEKEQASESRCNRSDSPRDAYGTSSRRSPRPSARPLAVRRLEVADEASHRVEVCLLERFEKRPGIALSEEAAGVRDPEPFPRHVLEPREVVEVDLVRDDANGAACVEAAYLGGDRRRHA